MEPLQKAARQQLRDERSRLWPRSRVPGVRSQEGTEFSGPCPLGSEGCPQSHPEGMLFGNHETPNTLRFG